MIHLFCECSITKSLWHSLQKTFGSLLTLPALDPLISIVSRWDINNPNNALVNHIVLLFKKFLYQNKSNPQRIHILALNHYIKLVERIEQKIAYDALKLDTHFKKWEPVQIIFELKKIPAESLLRPSIMGGRLGHGGRVVRVSLEMFPQSPGTASPPRATSYSAIFLCMRV